MLDTVEVEEERREAEVNADRGLRMDPPVRGDWSGLLLSGADGPTGGWSMTGAARRARSMLRGGIKLDTLGGGTARNWYVPLRLGEVERKGASGGASDDGRRRWPMAMAGDVRESKAISRLVVLL